MRSGLLERLLRQPDKLLNSKTAGIFYSRVEDIPDALGSAAGSVVGVLDRLRAYFQDHYVDDNMNLACLETAMESAQKEMRKIGKPEAGNEFAKEMGEADDATYGSEKQLFNDTGKLVITQFNTEWNATMIECGEPE